MDFEIGIIGIGLARKQAFKFTLGSDFANIAQALLGLGNGFGIAFGFAKLDQTDIVFEFLGKRLVTIDGIIKPGAFLHDFLRVFRLVPQRGIFGQRVQFVEASKSVIPVKDASSAVPSTA